MGLRISTALKALLFHGQMAAWLLALVTTVAGRLEWAAAAAAVALGAHMAGRLWSRQSPVPMPYFMRWILLVPRGPHSPTRLRRVLQPRNGERILEIGPGVGVHAVSIAAALRPDGVLDVLDVQREMLDDLVRRAARAGLTNIVARQGDAQELPYPDSTFDAAYLISVLGEVPDAPLALRELRRVLKPAARLIIGEVLVDPDFISLPVLRKMAGDAGFAFERHFGPRFAYGAVFRPIEVGRPRTSREKVDVSVCPPDRGAERPVQLGILERVAPESQRASDTSRESAVANPKLQRYRITIREIDPPSGNPRFMDAVIDSIECSLPELGEEDLLRARNRYFELLDKLISLTPCSSGGGTSLGKVDTSG